MKGINIFLADGFEDIEALGTNDVLRRAGLRCELVGIREEPFVSSAHRVTIGVDDCLPFLHPDHEGTGEKDVMIFPGGMPGSKSLAECKPLIEMMQAHYDAGGSVAAICASPGLSLSQLRGVKGHKVTCFDGFEDKLLAAGAEFEARPAITSGRIITGRSAGHTIAFALEIVKMAAPVRFEEVREQLFLSTL